ncbi:hypothetical protein LTR70_010600 [Exophiala xenobiotica]|uniref:Uncharacterized protein n=1 Tax=Lithohypha guttulata TaxID=1690604 RepID=A0ABR0JTW8_9EURO|nr:hypothetical protein LTR24_010573 [Lithohypha guttulata]KAK5309108.1 hypothetical protein LTR70_010600 [Exophiala xenobiotica]
MVKEARALSLFAANQDGRGHVFVLRHRIEQTRPPSTQELIILVLNIISNFCKICKMQLLVRTEASPASTNAAQTQPSARLPYSKAYQQQSHLLRELELQHAHRKHLQQTLLRKKRQLGIVEPDNSLDLSAKLLKQQVQSLECQTTTCEGAIATLRSQLDLNMVDPEGLEEDEEQHITASVLSAWSEVFGFGIDWPTSSALAHTSAYRVAVEQDLAEGLEKASLDAQENPVRFVPAGGWEKVLGTWV